MACSAWPTVGGLGHSSRAVSCCWWMFGKGCSTSRSLCYALQSCIPPRLLHDFAVMLPLRVALSGVGTAGLMISSTLVINLNAIQPPCLQAAALLEMSLVCLACVRRKDTLSSIACMAHVCAHPSWACTERWQDSCCCLWASAVLCVIQQHHITVEDLPSITARTSGLP